MAVRALVTLTLCAALAAPTRSGATVESLTCAANINSGVVSVAQAQAQYWSQGGYCGETSIRSVASAHGIYAPDTFSRRMFGLPLWTVRGALLVKDSAPQGIPGKRVSDAFRRYGLNASDVQLSNGAALKALALRELGAGRPFVWTVYTSGTGYTDVYYDHIVSAVGLTADGDGLIFDDHYAESFSCRRFASLTQTRKACNVILKGSGFSCARGWWLGRSLGACYCAMPKDAVTTVSRALLPGEVPARLSVFVDADADSPHWRQLPGVTTRENGWRLSSKQTFLRVAAASRLWARLLVRGLDAGAEYEVRRWEVALGRAYNVTAELRGPPTSTGRFRAVAAEHTYTDALPFAPTTAVVFKVFRAN